MTLIQDLIHELEIIRSATPNQKEYINFTICIEKIKEHANKNKKPCTNCNGDGFLKYGLYGNEDYHEEDCDQCDTTGCISTAPTPSPEEQVPHKATEIEQCFAEIEMVVSYLSKGNPDDSGNMWKMLIERINLLKAKNNIV